LHVPSSDVRFDPPCPLFPASTRSRTIVELGSGTGYTGLALIDRLCHDDRIVLTDLPEVCEGILSRNVGAHPRLTVSPLAWGDDRQLDAFLGHHVDIDAILLIDCVYFTFLHEPLLRTLVGLTDAHPEIPLIIAYKVRSLTNEQAFWSLFGTVAPSFAQRWSLKSPTGKYFSYDVVHVQRGDEVAPWRRLGLDDQAYVFVALRRPRSCTAGDATAEDDTFERLLFAHIDLD
jgi:hypothetical protein